MHQLYREALDRAERDPEVRAIIVTGRGDAFCVGGDSAALEGHVGKGGYDAGMPTEPTVPGAGLDDRFLADFAYHFALRTPTIAALPGPAAGVGLVLACYCDIRFAVPAAKLTAAHGPLALPAEYGISWLLPRLIGASRAAELLLSSRVFTTDEAHAWGLIHQLYEPADLTAGVQRYAADLISRNAEGAIAASKHQLYLDLHRDVRSSVEDAQARLDAHTKTADFARGVEALVNRTGPAFEDVRD